MDERVDILDEQGKPTGESCLKSEAHRNGLLHPTIHVWLYTPDGRVLIQQRGENKATHPLLWDVSVAGHVSAGEEVITAAIREVEEEVGLTISESTIWSPWALIRPFTKSQKILLMPNCITFFCASCRCP